MLARLSMIVMALVMALSFPMVGFAGSYASSSAGTGMDRSYGAVDQGAIDQGSHGYGALDQAPYDQGYGALDQGTFDQGYGYGATEQGYGAVDQTYSGDVTLYDRNENTLVVRGTEGQKTFDVSRAAVIGTVRTNEPVSVTYHEQNGQMVASSVQVEPRTSMRNEVRSEARATDHGTQASATTR